MAGLVEARRRAKLAACDARRSTLRVRANMRTRNTKTLPYPRYILGRVPLSSRDGTYKTVKAKFGSGGGERKGRARSVRQTQVTPCF